MSIETLIKKEKQKALSTEDLALCWELFAKTIDEINGDLFLDRLGAHGDTRRTTAEDFFHVVMFNFVTFDMVDTLTHRGILQNSSYYPFAAMNYWTSHFNPKIDDLSLQAWDDRLKKPEKVFNAVNCDLTQEAYYRYTQGIMRLSLALNHLLARYNFFLLSTLDENPAKASQNQKHRAFLKKKFNLEELEPNRLLYARTRNKIMKLTYIIQKIVEIGLATASVSESEKYYAAAFKFFKALQVNFCPERRIFLDIADEPVRRAGAYYFMIFRELTHDYNLIDGLQDSMLHEEHKNFDQVFELQEKNRPAISLIPAFENMHGRVARWNARTSLLMWNILRSQNFLSHNKDYIPANRKNGYIVQPCNEIVTFFNNNASEDFSTAQIKNIMHFYLNPTTTFFTTDRFQKMELFLNRVANYILTTDNPEIWRVSETDTIVNSGLFFKTRKLLEPFGHLAEQALEDKNELDARTVNIKLKGTSEKKFTKGLKLGM